MAAMTRNDVSNQVRIFDLYACKSAIDAAPNPKAKFKIFDELTDKGLDSVSLDILNYIYNRNNAAGPSQTHFPRGGIEETLAARAFQTMDNSIRLYEHLMQSIGDSGKRQLYFVCHNVDTYIHNKIYNALGKIHNLPFSHEVCANQFNPLHVICDNLWAFEPFKHVDSCPCHGQTTYMIITHDAGLPDVLTILLTINVKPKLE